jgi:hypothetical protein
MRPISQVKKRIDMRWHEGQMSAEKKHLCAYYTEADGKVATVGCKEDLCQLDVRETATIEPYIKAGGCAEDNFSLKDLTAGKDYSCYSKSAGEGYGCFCKV